MASRTSTAWGECMRKTIVLRPVCRSTFENSGPSFLAFTDRTVCSGMSGGSLRARGREDIDSSFNHSIRSRYTRTVEFFPSSRLRASMTISDVSPAVVSGRGSSFIRFSLPRVGLPPWRFKCAACRRLTRDRLVT